MSATSEAVRAPQRLQALERANEIRLARAELKRRIVYGATTAAEVILQPPVEAHSWAIRDLLLAQRRWGATRCRKFLVRNQISETKPVGALTERQRRMLADQLDGGAVSEPILRLAGTSCTSAETALDIPASPPTPDLLELFGGPERQEPVQQLVEAIAESPVLPTEAAVSVSRPKPSGRRAVPRRSAFSAIPVA